MKILGMWELQLYSIFHLFSTNRAESFNAWLKRNFPKRRAYTEDQIISGGHNIISGKLNIILKAQYSVGGGYSEKSCVIDTTSMYKMISFKTKKLRNHYCATDLTQQKI